MIDSGFALVSRPRRLAFFGLIHQLLPMTANAVGQEDPLQLDPQADFLILEQRATFENGADRINFRVGTSRLLASGPFPIAELGAGQFPAPIPRGFPLGMPRLHGMTIPGGSTFALQAWDRKPVAGTDNLRVLHVGLKKYKRPTDFARGYTEAEPFRAVANFSATDGGVGALAASGAGVAVVPIDADADYDVYSFSILATDPRLTIQVIISGSDALWFNRPAHALLLGGTAFGAAIPAGGTPFILPKPYRIPGPGSLQVLAADLSAAPNTVFVIFHGLRCKPRGGIRINVPPGDEE